MINNWREVLKTCNPPHEGKLDFISKWLVITRACVFSMTWTSGILALMLAVLMGKSVDFLAWFIATIGIVIAHVSNNIMNDLFDEKGGIDTENYPRALYAPHPIIAGWVSRTGLTTAAVVTNLVGLTIAISLILWKGMPVAYFALAGFVLSFFYVAPPFRLKHHGFGEPSVLVVWGPLMIGGTYFVTTGEFSWIVILASIPYGITVMSVLMGKHLDKFEYDAPKGVRTLPIVLGYPLAKAVTMSMWLVSYVLIAALVSGGILWWGVLLLYLFAIPRLIKVWRMYLGPKPTEPPSEDYFRTWPLYYVSLSFHYNKMAGGMYMLGLLVSVMIKLAKPEWLSMMKF